VDGWMGGLVWIPLLGFVFLGKRKEGVGLWGLMLVGVGAEDKRREDPFAMGVDTAKRRVKFETC